MTISTIGKSARAGGMDGGLGKGLLLDRDGVINIDRDHVGTADRFTFMPDLFPFLRAAVGRGYRLAVVTNQSGVGRGIFSAQDYEILTAHMRRGLQAEGIALDLVLACFEHPEGRGDCARESFWRKPNPGMVLEVVRRLRLDPARSVLLGDQPRDLQAARAGGIGTCLWLTDKAETAGDGAIKVRDFDAALAHL